MSPSLSINPMPREQFGKFLFFIPEQMWGNTSLLEAPVRVFIEPKGKSREVVWWCEHLADQLGRRNICVLSGVEGAVWEGIVTGTVRHAGPCIMFSHKPLVLEGRQVRQPVRQARVWDAYLDPAIHLYVRGAGLLRPARALATHIIEVPDFISRDFNPSEFIARHFDGKDTDNGNR